MLAPMMASPYLGSGGGDAVNGAVIEARSLIAPALTDDEPARAHAATCAISARVASITAAAKAGSSGVRALPLSWSVIRMSRNLKPPCYTDISTQCFMEVN